MIELHRLCARRQEREAFHVNPDLIATIEAHPDTVITLTTGSKVVVDEPVEDIVERVRQWRAGILRDAMGDLKPAPVRPITLA